VVSPHSSRRGAIVRERRARRGWLRTVDRRLGTNLCSVHLASALSTEQRGRGLSVALLLGAKALEASVLGGLLTISTSSAFVEGRPWAALLSGTPTFPRQRGGPLRLVATAALRCGSTYLVGAIMDAIARVLQARESRMSSLLAPLAEERTGGQRPRRSSSTEGEPTSAPPPSWFEACIGSPGLEGPR